MKNPNRSVIKCLTLTVIACLISTILGSRTYETTVKADTISTLRPSAILSVYHAKTLPKKVSIKNPVKEEISRVFGDYTLKAMKLLQGKKCHENLGLNTNAVNDNRKWGGIGRDRGVFQINDVYHPTVSDACAFDYKCNIKYAWKMFVEDNHTFKRWTCGKFYGI